MVCSVSLQNVRKLDTRRTKEEAGKKVSYKNFQSLAEPRLCDQPVLLIPVVHLQLHFFWEWEKNTHPLNIKNNEEEKCLSILFFSISRLHIVIHM